MSCVSAGVRRLCQNPSPARISMITPAAKATLAAAAGAAQHAVITVTGTAWVMRRPRGKGLGAASAKSGRFTRSRRQIGGKH